MEKIAAVIGGGASGVLSAIAVLRRPTSVTELMIFDPAEELGAGLAYRGNDSELLLNVDAEKMSARSEEPGAFVQYLKAKFPDALTDPHYPYVQRRYFREYLQYELAEAIRLSSSRVKFRHVKTKVQNLKRSGSGWELITSDGMKVGVHAVVLAMGYGPRKNLGSFVVDSEEPATLRLISASEKVLVVGTGLSAIDAWRVMSLGARKGAQTDFISRHGLFPISHSDSALGKPFEIPRSIVGLSPLQLLALVRAFHAGGVALPVIADALRVHAIKIWRGWTRRERKVFVRHLKTYWELIRHRLPRGVASELSTAQGNAQVRVFAGRIRSIMSDGVGVTLEWTDRKTGQSVREKYDRVVNALGAPIQTRLTEVDGAEKWKKLGLEESELGLENFGAPALWTVGPLSRARKWETTAVPEIRLEAESVASGIDENPVAGRFASFRLHPHGAGEGYLEHGLRSIAMAWNLRALAGYALLHAIVPKLHRDTVSDRVLNLAKKLSLGRTRRVRESR